jgi:hypothetical protein
MQQKTEKPVLTSYYGKTHRTTIYCNPIPLEDWVSHAQYQPLTWFKTRKLLWDKFCACTARPSINSRYRAEDYVHIPHDLFVTVKSVLTERNDNLTDDKKLAFEKSLQEIDSCIEDWRGFHELYYNSGKPADADYSDEELRKANEEGLKELLPQDKKEIEFGLPKKDVPSGYEFTQRELEPLWHYVQERFEKEHKSNEEKLQKISDMLFSMVSQLDKLTDQVSETKEEEVKQT